VEYLGVYSVITFPVPFHNDSTYYFTDIWAVFLLPVEEFYVAEVTHPIPVLDKFAVDSVKAGRHSACITALFHNDATGIYMFQVSSDNTRNYVSMVLDYPHV